MSKVEYEIVEIDKKHYGHSYSKNMALLHIRRKGDRLSVCHGTYMNETELSLSDWQLDYNSVIYCSVCETYAKKAILEAKHIPIVEEDIRESKFSMLRQRLNDMKEQFVDVPMPTTTPSVASNKSVDESQLTALTSELPPIQVPSLLARVRQKVSEGFASLSVDDSMPIIKKEPTLRSQEHVDNTFDTVSELPAKETLNEPKKILTTGGLSFLKELTPERDKDFAEQFHGENVVKKVFLTEESSVPEETVDIPNVFRKSRENI